jgi:hypothetical protein
MTRPTCTRCQGSGEGWHADQRCTRCGGGGMEPEQFEDEDREVRLTSTSASRTTTPRILCDAQPAWLHGFVRPAFISENNACNAQAVAHGEGRNAQHTMKKTYAKQNQFGYWVGYIVSKDGTASAITNAQLTEHRALAIAERISARNS